MILTALNNYYERLLERGEEGVPSFGYSQEKISFCLVLSESGELVDIQDIRDTRGKKPVTVYLTVPQSFKRPGKVTKPFFLWDKASYALGLVSSQDAEKRGDAYEKACERASATHQAFKTLHRDNLVACDSNLVTAFLAFLDWWTPERFNELSFAPEEIRDANLVFRLDGERQYLHDDAEAKRIWQTIFQQPDSVSAVCLVSGENRPVARTHPAIKGVRGAQSSGASIVSFNLDAFTSYGKDQGINAPVSERSAFAYTTVLNYLLNAESNQRLQLGDTSVVFWAHASSEQQSRAAEDTFAALLDPPTTDQSETDKLRSTLEVIRAGRPLRDLDPALDDGTQLYVLGLAPNAARLSIRFWETGTLREFAERLGQHYQDLVIKPLPWKTAPSVWRLLLQTVPHREGSKPRFEDISPHLGGELARAILTGARYPRSLLTNLIMRMRADGDVSGLRVAMCKAVLAREWRTGYNTNAKEIPMSLDRENTDSGYLLGRLFAMFERIQRAALGGDVNATIRDRYYGAASATPGSIFPVLIRNGQHHLSRLRKDKTGLAVNLEKEIAEIVDKLGDQFPKSLRIESQGRFAIGYYHQTKADFTSNPATSTEGDES